VAEITFKSISPTFWIQILPNKFYLNLSHRDLSSNTKGTFQFLPNFQLRFNLIFSDEIIQYSRTFALQVKRVMEPSPCTPPRHKERNLKHPGSVDLITTRQNKLPSFIDR
jgi:hypothetical protein